ncbi:fungal-specific transcription factor domain-containing protein [Xylariales sp. PMI_506]|nr:fungal-specific transcription factor domain-containing protein [Xylariales sp. PMI_506]
MSASGSLDPALDLMLGAAEQSCKECRRRKARCDRAIPICSLCIKYTRHCLYEKHSRTPLTRRHLTEVEARLEKAEALIRRLRRENGNSAAIGHETQVSGTPYEKGGPLECLNGVNLEQPPPRSSASVQSETLPLGTLSDEAVQYSSAIQQSVPSPSGPVLSPQIPQRVTLAHVTASTETKPGDGLVETPPRDDFEWDELDTLQQHYPAEISSYADLESGVDGQLKDGMASLAVDEKDGGYLGVASGAALLRIMEPNSRMRRFSSSSNYHRIHHLPLPLQPDPNRHIVDTMIDAYFATYHISYPIIHEPTFRAQYSEVIPQPHGRSWPILAYIVAAIGVYSSSFTDSDLDLQLFAQARALLSFDFLEMGNSTLVQALTLISNYQQKRDKPNSGWNYLGLAVRMATGLGFHKEFPGWNISPLKMEIRRRIWWSLCVFDVGATITFSRPILWPYKGVEVSLPMNVTDRELTANSRSYPSEKFEVTPYTAVSTQARFHLSTNDIYSRVISKPLPAADELLRLDRDLLTSWQDSLPAYFNETSQVPPKYAFSHAVMRWRCRNLRIIMYRPFVIRRALNVREGVNEDSEANLRAYKTCLDEAESTIKLISEYWSNNEHNRLAAWYALYFLFQAALIPCICLRNGPFEPGASAWADQINTTLGTIEALGAANSSAARCHQVITDLCGQYLRKFQLSLNPSRPAPAVRPDAAVSIAKTTQAQGSGNDQAQEFDNFDTPLEYSSTTGPSTAHLGPIAESPQTQLGNVFPMMWPNVNALEVADEVMGDDAWIQFLTSGM